MVGLLKSELNPGHQAKVLLVLSERLSKLRSGIPVSISERFVPVTPLHKICLIANY